MIDVVIAPFYADICNNVRMLHSSEIAFSDCHLNPDSRELTRAGKSIPIEPKTLDLLIYLINNRDSRQTAREIADILGVDLLLTGSVRKAGNQVRISMQLADAAEDVQLWSESYDRELTDIFAVQAEIAGNVVASVSRGEASDIHRYEPTDSPEAYDFYLHGRQAFHEYDRGNLQQAREMFERAIEADPGFARAWAGVALPCPCSAITARPRTSSTQPSISIPCCGRRGTCTRAPATPRAK